MKDPEKILSQIVTALQEGLGERLITVVLYGSRARGQARRASDWDLFIIASDLPAQLWERHILLKRSLPAAYRGAVSLLAKKMLAELAREDESPSMVMKTYRQVGVEVEDRRPGEEVLLTFLAPHKVLARFLADLRSQGLEVTEEPIVPGVLLTCRLKPRNLQ